ncbi:MAG: glycoside hydrolase family 2 TIM barrel-domain containing protein [Ilumatobacteraceae bacterium]
MSRTVDRCVLDDFGPRSWARPEVTAFDRLPMSTHFERPSTMSLDGMWAFVLRRRPEEVTQEDLTGSTADWASIEVPSSWTMQGFGDHPRYVNIQMPFDGPPPHVPDANPTGVHRRTVTLPADWAGQRIVLHVGAAETVLYVHVDGRPVAMGKDSRLPHDIELTGVVEPGVPFELALTVVRWSDATYLEDQDHWHHAGLHRSVCVYATELVHLADVHAVADFDPATGAGSLEVRASVGADGLGPDGWSVRVEVDGREAVAPVVVERPNSDIVHNFVFVAGPNATVRLDLPSVAPWTAETPNLHRVDVRLVDATGEVRDAVSLDVGFRRVEVVGTELLVNGRPVLIKGVNRHDHDPRRGKAVTSEGLEAELLLMKQHNINAIRTSHYPNDPYLYDLADRLGLYVFGEANLETHAYLRSLTKDPRWGTAIHERITRMALRDKNHPSIIAWSLGNESGRAPILTAMAEWLRAWDPTRPVHYEGVLGELLFETLLAGTRPDLVDTWKRADSTTDLIAPMYPEVDDLVRWASSTPDRPLIMCEYAFGMGNSCGGLADYWDAIRSYAGLQGGFVWVWRDQALVQQLPDGTERLAFGGDFDAMPHDGAFCLDGVVDAALVPRPARFELAAVIAPVRIEARDAAHGSFCIRNEYDFVDLAHLTPSWTIEVDGVVAADGVLDPLTTAAGDTIDVRIPMPDVPLAAGQRAYVTLRFALTEPCAWAPAGHVIAAAQFAAGHAAGPSNGPDTPSSSPIDLDDFAPRLALWRAPIDNERRRSYGRPTIDKWERLGLRDAHDDLPLLTTTSPNGDDGVEVEHVVHVPDQYVDIARVGVRLHLGAGVHSVEWLGDGPHEGYADRCASTTFGRWTTAVDDWQVPYVVPQASGNRTGVRWLRFLDARGATVLVIDRLDGLDVTVSRWTDEEIAAATHREELPPSDRCWVWIDARHRGVGTGALGPDVAPRHRVGPGTYRWTYRIR